MSTVDNTIGAGSAARPAKIRVWDPFVRVFHWLLATLFLAAYVTGDDAGQVHIVAGYAIAGLIALRIIWGFVGPRYARFQQLRPVAAHRSRLSARHGLAQGVPVSRP